MVARIDLGSPQGLPPDRARTQGRPHHQTLAADGQPPARHGDLPAPADRRPLVRHRAARLHGFKLDVPARPARRPQGRPADRRRAASAAADLFRRLAPASAPAESHCGRQHLARQHHRLQQHDRAGGAGQRGPGRDLPAARILFVVCGVRQPAHHTDQPGAAAA